MSKKNPLIVLVKSNGETIGKLTPKEFMDYMGRDGQFLSALVKLFNDAKEASGEPERVEVVLNITERRKTVR